MVGQRCREWASRRRMGEGRGKGGRIMVEPTALGSWARADTAACTCGLCIVLTVPLPTGAGTLMVMVTRPCLFGIGML